jgi:hypothetical protein
MPVTTDIPIAVSAFKNEIESPTKTIPLFKGKKKNEYDKAPQKRLKARTILLFNALGANFWL